ncbi:MAG: hypothetical protein FWF83_05955 [Clostridiales bacterium]|nr:hypothetical protein [Clostridiales bacterium]
MIEYLACKLGRNDETPNIALAEKLCDTEDQAGIREIVGGLGSREKGVAGDCIKVLYEVGQRKPELIAEYAGVFITALSGKDNRIVWGSMTALACIAPIAHEALDARIPEILHAYRNGSVITVDNSISVFARLCKADNAYMEEIFPLLLEHLASCRAKEIPQHAERIAECIDQEHREAFVKTLEARHGELTDAQMRRLGKVIKAL